MATRCRGFVITDPGNSRQCRRWVTKNNEYCVYHIPKSTSSTQIQSIVENDGVTRQSNTNQVCDRATVAISGKYDKELPLLWQHRYVLETKYKLLMTDLKDLESRYIMKYTKYVKILIRNLSVNQNYDVQMLIQPLYDVIADIKKSSEWYISQRDDLKKYSTPHVVDTDSQAMACVQYGQYVISLQKWNARIRGLCYVISDVLNSINTVIENVKKLLTDRTNMLKELVQICTTLESDSDGITSTDANTLIQSLHGWLSSDIIKLVENLLSPYIVTSINFEFS